MALRRNILKKVFLFRLLFLGAAFVQGPVALLEVCEASVVCASPDRWPVAIYCRPPFPLTPLGIRNVLRNRCSVHVHGRSLRLSWVFYAVHVAELSLGRCCRSLGVTTRYARGARLRAHAYAAIPIAPSLGLRTYVAIDGARRLVDTLSACHPWQRGRRYGRWRRLLVMGVLVVDRSYGDPRLIRAGRVPV